MIFDLLDGRQLQLLTVSDMAASALEVYPGGEIPEYMSELINGFGIMVASLSEFIDVPKNLSPVEKVVATVRQLCLEQKDNKAFTNDGTLQIPCVHWLDQHGYGQILYKSLLSACEGEAVNPVTFAELSECLYAISTMIKGFFPLLTHLNLWEVPELYKQAGLSSEQYSLLSQYAMLQESQGPTERVTIKVNPPS